MTEIADTVWRCRVCRRMLKAKLGPMGIILPRSHKHEGSRCPGGDMPAIDWIQECKDEKAREQAEVDRLRSSRAPAYLTVRSVSPPGITYFHAPPSRMARRRGRR